MEDSWRLSAENQSICQSSHFCRDERRNTKTEGPNRKWRTAGDYQQRTRVSVRVVTFVGRIEEIQKEKEQIKKWRTAGDYQQRTRVYVRLVTFVGGKEEIQKETERIKNEGPLEIISREPEYLLEQSLLQGGKKKYKKRRTE